MAKKATKEDPVTISGSNSFSDALPIKPGDPVSLNCKRQVAYNAYGLELNIKNPYGFIPLKTTPQAINQFAKSINMGVLILGKVNTQDTPDPQVLDRYLKELNKGGYIEMRDAIIGLTKTVTLISGWQPVDILKKMHEKERDTRARIKVMAYLEEAIRSCVMPGPTNVPFNETLHARATTVYKPEYKR